MQSWRTRKVTWRCKGTNRLATSNARRRLPCPTSNRRLPRVVITFVFPSLIWHITYAPRSYVRVSFTAARINVHHARNIIPAFPSPCYFFSSPHHQVGTVCNSFFKRHVIFYLAASSITKRICILSGLS